MMIPPSLFALTIDRTIHLGDFVMTIVGAIMAAVGYGVRKCYKLIIAFFGRVEHHGEQIEQTAVVVDTHSAVLHKAGLSKLTFPRLSKKRRSTDRVSDDLADGVIISEG